MKRLFLLFALLFLLPAWGWGASIVAKPDATNPATAIMYKTGNLGNCSDADGTFTTTNSSLNVAAAAAGASGILSVCAATYTGTMINATATSGISVPGTNWTLNGSGKTTTILDGTSVTASGFIDNLQNGTTVSK